MVYSYYFSKEKLIWTKHSLEKMAFYQLSENRVKRVLRHPHRIEKGIAPETLASMQKAGSKKHPYEIWVMYQLKTNGKSQKKEKPSKSKGVVIISCWKYPGQSKPGEKIPIPEDILEEILKNYT
ncbi:MAG: hypothetical protein AB7D02_02400 [Candidatus Paceibacterota bacterium]